MLNSDGSECERSLEGARQDCPKVYSGSLEEFDVKRAIHAENNTSRRSTGLAETIAYLTVAFYYVSRGRTIRIYIGKVHSYLVKLAKYTRRCDSAHRGIEVTEIR